MTPTNTPPAEGSPPSNSPHTPDVLAEARRALDEMDAYALYPAGSEGESNHRRRLRGLLTHIAHLHTENARLTAANEEAGAIIKAYAAATERLSTERHEALEAGRTVVEAAEKVFNEANDTIAQLTAEREEAEVRAVAGIIGMDPGQGRDRVFAAVRDRLHDRRHALDETQRLLNEQGDLHQMLDEMGVSRVGEDGGFLHDVRKRLARLRSDLATVTAERDGLKGVAEAARAAVAAWEAAPERSMPGDTDITLARLDSALQALDRAALSALPTPTAGGPDAP